MRNDCRSGSNVASATEQTCTHDDRCVEHGPTLGLDEAAARGENRSEGIRSSGTEAEMNGTVN
jgi:hypothetical protein